MPNDWSGGYSDFGYPVGQPIYNPNNAHKRRAPPSFGKPQIKKPNTTSNTAMATTGNYGMRNYMSRGRSTRSFSSRRFSKRRIPRGPYALLSTSAATRHQNSKYPVPEVKMVDVSFSLLSAAGGITSSGNFQQQVGPIFSINAIAQGTTNAQRIGASVTILSCAFRIDFDLGTTPTVTSFRHMLVWDRQPNNYSTVPVATDILQTASLTSFLAFDNVDRFVVLRNELLTLAPNGPQTQFIEDFVKINMKSRYVNTATTEPNSGAILALFISDQASGVTAPQVSSATYRVRFKDN